VLLLITWLVAMVNFQSERTNVLHGFVRLVLFATYIVLIFD
jgi:Ca2+/H+ antiporter